MSTLVATFIVFCTKQTLEPGSVSYIRLEQHCKQVKQRLVVFRPNVFSPRVFVSTTLSFMNSSSILGARKNCISAFGTACYNQLHTTFRFHRYAHATGKAIQIAVDMSTTQL